MYLFLPKAAKLNITVTTNPSGPIYKAGSLYEVICNVSGGSPPYEYEWSVGCTSTNDFITDSVHTGAIIGPYITTSLTCLDVHRCRVTDSSRIKGVGEYIIESVKGRKQIFIHQLMYQNKVSLSFIILQI